MSNDRLSSTLSALADPTRRDILARLASKDATVTELAARYDMSFAAVSKHLKVLEHAKLISRGREAQWRPCHLEARPLEAVSAWLDDYRRFWDRSLDALDEYLQVMQGTSAPPPRLRSSARSKTPKRSTRRTSKDRR